MENNKIVKCEIEHHAILFALLSKYAIEACGERGKDAILKGVNVYGNERGQRMAKRAIANGDALDDIVNFFAYTEWQPYPGQMEVEIAKNKLTFVQKYSKCAWCTAWKKYNLLEYGKYYCVSIDNAVLAGFNPTLKLTVHSNLSWGALYCDFDWEISLTEADEKRLATKKAELGKSCVKDFNYHTAHVLSSFKKTIEAELGEAGGTIVKRALDEYINLFGSRYLDPLENVFE